MNHTKSKKRPRKNQLKTITGFVGLILQKDYFPPEKGVPRTHGGGVGDTPPPAGLPCLIP